MQLSDLLGSLLKSQYCVKRIFPKRGAVDTSHNSKNKATIRPLLNYPHKYIKCYQIPGCLVFQHLGHKNHQQWYCLRKASHQIRDPDKRQTKQDALPQKCLSAPRFMMQKIWPKLSVWFMVASNKPKGRRHHLPPNPQADFCNWANKIPEDGSRLFAEQSD